MSAIASRLAWTTVAVGTNPREVTFALPVGTGRKLIVYGVARADVSTLRNFTGATFDGTAMSFFVTNEVLDGANDLISSWFYYDVPDGKSDGNYTIALTLDVDDNNIAVTAWCTTGDTAGAPQVDYAFTSADLTVAPALATVSGDALLTVGIRTGTSDFSGDPSSSQLTFGNVSRVSTVGWRTGKADVIADATETVTVTWTRASGTDGMGGYLVNTSPVPSAPTITVQPSAQTKVLTNANTATFSVTATGTGGLTYDWELESGVGTGVYANLADGNGATWTGQTASSCTATLTTKTLSGRRVRCNVTDSNGTTTTNAVALTIYDGPQLTTFPATNGSGVSTATLTCDYVTGTGEAIEVAITLADGRLAVTTTTT